MSWGFGYQRLSTTADASSAASTGYRFFRVRLADRARVAEAYYRSGMPAAITYRACLLVSFEATLLSGLRAANRSALKSDAVTKDLGLVFTFAEHNVGKSSCHSNNAARLPSRILPSEIFEDFFTM